MSSEKRFGPPPAYYQTEDPNVQTTFTYGNQYHQYQRGSQYPSPHDAQNTDNQHQPQYNARGHVVTTMVSQPGAMEIKRTPVPQNWMGPAVLACLCCFWPTGICAIIAASNANEAAANGDVVEAEKHSKKSALVRCSFRCNGANFNCSWNCISYGFLFIIQIRKNIDW